jgi:hypothetical protein
MTTAISQKWLGAVRSNLRAVLLVNPAEPDAAEKLRRWSDTGRFRGVRLLAEWF